MKRSFTILLIWVTLSLAGLAFLPLSHVQWQPSQTLPSLTVRFGWNNVSGRVVEQEVTSLLEGGLNRITGVSNISSVSYNNGGYINVEFNKTTDMDAARFEAASVLRQLYPKLPEGVSYPSISLNRPNNEGEKTLLVYYLLASANPAGIQQFAEDIIKTDIAQIDGVNRVQVYGATPYEWMITYDAEQLAAVKLSPEDIQQAVSHYFQAEALGMVQDDQGAWMQLTIGHKPNVKPAMLESIPVTVADGRQIVLGDVASIRFTEQEPTSFYRINGMNTINIVTYASSQANHVVLAKHIIDRMKQLESVLPPGYHLKKAYDSTEYISKELDKIYVRTIATILILLIFILLTTRKWRLLLLIVVSIIANICISLGFYYLLEIEIHLYSLAGITISLGLIIDNTIVMMEHIRSRGNRRVFLAILAATLTSVIALSAIFFLDDRFKVNLIDFVIVIILNLIVSLASAWFLTPALYYRLVGTVTEKQAPVSMRRRRRQSWFSRVYAKIVWGIRRRQWIAWIVLLLGFGLPTFLLPAKIDKETSFAKIYNKTIGSVWYQEKAKSKVDKVLGGSLRLFAQFVYEGSQWNNNRERTSLSVVATMPPGATIDQMNHCMESLEKYLIRFKEIETFTTNIDNPQNATMNINFKPEFDYGSFPYYLKNELITWSINSGAADWSVYGVGDGFSNRMTETTGSYQLQLYGYNYDLLYDFATAIGKELTLNTRIKEINIMSRYSWYKYNNREFALSPDIDRLAINNISLPTYFNMVNLASGNERNVATTLTDGAYRPVKIRARQLAETDRWRLYNSLLANGDLSVKLSSVGDMVKLPEQRDVVKENQQYTMVVAYDYIGSYKFGQKLQKRTVDEYNAKLPLGFSIKSSSGWGWWQNEKQQYWMILIILIVMYVLCAILFESLWKPLAVISVVPFGFIGLFLTFYLFHLNFDQGGFAALVLLCAITVNASIYIINDYNNITNSSRCSQRRIYLQAVHGKITPVLLTILSTILGMAPFLVGKHENFWFALAAGTVGGLLFSLIGILFYLPLFFGKRLSTSSRRHSSANE